MPVTVTLNLSDLVSNLNANDRTDIIQAMACEDDVVRHVVEMLALGSTDNGSAGPRATRRLQASPYAIDAAKAYLAAQAGEIAQAEIDRLRGLLGTCERRLEDTLQRLQETQTAMDRKVCDLEEQLRRSRQGSDHFQGELVRLQLENKRLLEGRRS